MVYKVLKFRYLGVVLAAWLVFAALPAEARTRKGDKLVKQGREFELRKQYEKALELYEQAMSDDPGDTGYQLASRRVRFQAAMSRVALGQKLRDQGELEPALAEFLKAYAIDPSAAVAEQEIRRTREMMEREKKQPGGQAAERGLTPADQAREAMTEKVARIQPVPELKPIQRQIGALKMNNQPIRVLYETVGKLAGINVIFDAEFQPPPGRQNYTVDLSNSTLEEALDYLAVLTKTFWKPLSHNAIFVTNDNPTKRRDFEDFVVKVFYIKNATTVQELQEILTTVRGITEIRRAFTFNSQNAILFRGTADQIALAEKLINDLDKPRSEVVIDVVVMEANRAKVRDLAAALTTGGSPGIKLPINFIRSEGVIPLNTIKNIRTGDFSVNIPGLLLQAVLSDSTTRVLQQPQVRAVEGQKASLKIGDRIPYAQGSFAPGFGVGGAGVSPLVSTQFNFADVGVNVDIVPKVHGRDEVSMHIDLEISSVSGRVELGGVSQPIISRKLISHDIRIREGEVNLLGGIINTQDTKVISGIPGLATLPVVGKLFGTEHVEHNQGEMLIALIPRIVRSSEVTDLNLRGVAAGSDLVVRLSYAPKGEAPPPAAAPAPADEAAPPPAAPKPAVPAPGVQPAPTTPAPEPTVPTPGAEPAPTTPGPTAPAPAPEAAKPAPAPQGPVRLVFNPPSVQAQLSAPVTVTLQVENAVDLFTAPMRVKWDPKVLRLANIRAGALLSGDGQRVNFSENTLNDAGEASVVLNRLPGAGGISGSGTLLTLTFQAVGRGTTSIMLPEVSLRNSQLQPIAVVTPPLAVTVQ